jgi:serine/threonine-protein kinase
LTIVKGKRRDWTIGEKLARGGFGQVYLARSDDLDAVIKLVAKIPGADREFLVEELSGVRNVVPLLDRGETDDEWALVMPRADRSLRTHIDDQEDKRLDLDAALSIMIDIAEALVDLVVKGVVHRDLKPPNVLLFNGRWCLIDFGIARYAEATTATNTRKYAWSPQYAAPEQWRLDRATSATDVYALGIIGYEMLTGFRPFNGPDLSDFQQQHVEGRWPELPSSVPAPLAALLEQCLSKGPESRPTPADVLSRLQKQASAAPVTGGLAALQEANRAAVTRLVEESRLASAAQNEAERRVTLAQDANRQLHGMSVSLREALRVAAPAAVDEDEDPAGLFDFNERFAARGRPKIADRTARWSLRLGSAALTFSPGTFHETQPSLPFDVIDVCTVAVSQSSGRYGYRGRTHSVWFCDAQERGQYRWYETAFMDQPMMQRRLQSIDPFAVEPTSKEAQQALMPGVGTFQVAWPFTPVDPGEMDEFISRWANWFAQASGDALARPSRMPERPIDGSWRRK